MFCRVRPVSPDEHGSAESRNMVSFDADDDAVLCLSNKGKTMTFDLDKVFPPQATQEEVSPSRECYWLRSIGEYAYVYWPSRCIT